MFSPPKRTEPSISSTDDITKSATGAIRSLGKAIHKAATTVDGSSSTQDPGPRVPVIAFKLLDLVKMEDSLANKRGGLSTKAHTSRGASRPRPAPTRVAPIPAAATNNRHVAPQHNRVPTQPTRVSVPAASPPGSRQQTAASNVPRMPPPGASGAPVRQPQVAVRPTQAPPPPKRAEESLMDFGESPKPSLHHAASLPTGFPSSGQSNLTKAQKTQLAYKKKQATANRVWDDVDQRWVEVNPKQGTVHRGNTSAPPGVVGAATNGSGKKAVGIKLDASNAVGKSVNVQAAVSQRVNDMRESQQKALQEVREREMKKKESEAEEDAVRKKLEPKLKAWSEEHGKKKQLRALLANLHTILWPDANWKQVSLGDLLDDSKCKRCYHKASRVVHPDKTHHLDAEKRFMAKRIFDALTQAKVEFDEGNK